MMLPLTQRHVAPPHHLSPINSNLAALNSMSNMYSSSVHSQTSSLHINNQLSQLKPVCSLQQSHHQMNHWSSIPLAPPAQSYFKPEVSTQSQQHLNNNGTINNNNTIHQQAYKYSNGPLVRDISFSATMELESCVNAGNYANVHYETQRLDMAIEVGSQVLPSSNGPTASNSVPTDPPAREDSLDLYSTFREDSYSETSDDFSNESGDNRFSPGNPSSIPLPSVQTHRSRPILPDSLQNGADYGGNAVSTTAYYTEQHKPAVQGYHMMSHEYHHSIYGHAPVPVTTASNGSYTNDHHVHQYNNNEPYANDCGYNSTPSVSHNSLCTNYSNGLLPHPTHIVSVEDGLTGENNGPPEIHQSLHSVCGGSTLLQQSTSYTDLSLTSYTKLEPFSELLQNGVANGLSACKESYATALESDEGELEGQKDGTSSEAETETSSSRSSEDETLTDNFGEIIKKTMVETVSA